MINLNGVNILNERNTLKQGRTRIFCLFKPMAPSHLCICIYAFSCIFEANTLVSVPWYVTNINTQNTTHVHSIWQLIPMTGYQGGTVFFAETFFSWSPYFRQKDFDSAEPRTLYTHKPQKYEIVFFGCSILFCCAKLLLIDGWDESNVTLRFNGVQGLLEPQD